MFYSKEERLLYLGFDDFWFKTLGILILSFTTYFLFTDPFQEHPFSEIVINWGVSLLFSTFDWFIIRAIMIQLRNKYPALKDSVRRIVLFIIATIVTVILVDYIGLTMLSFILNVNYNFVGRSQALLSIILISIMTMAIYEAIYFYVRLKKSIREEEQSKQAIVQAQLDVLRNQAQPHFFFNTLNTLRDIIDQNSKQEAMVFVDKLSDIYRFLLESKNANLITLKDELKFAKAYLHIQAERFGDNLKVISNIPEVSMQDMVVPMSIQLLLENAIKHNVISNAKPLVINILVKDNKLVINNRVQPKSSQLPSTKIGLKNIQRRYALISKDSVEIENGDGEFTVSLPLICTSEQKNNHEDIDH